MPARSNGKKGCCVPSSNTVLFFYAFDRTLFMQVLITNIFTELVTEVRDFKEEG
jgi:hypothetical protein